MVSWIYSSPIGKLTLVAHEGDSLIGLRFGGSPEGALEEIPLLREAVRQLEMYFHGKLQSFDLPLALQGTPFQRRVWHALQEIPYGQTACYAQIAERIGCPRGVRAVGMANNRNPLPIIVPCHRVIGKDGSLVGYGGGLPAKEHLLSLEKRFHKGGEPA